jgi:hypothetical protein
VGGLVAYGVADVLDRDAVVAHDRDCGVTALVGAAALSRRKNNVTLIGRSAALLAHAGRAPRMHR